jgi:hypothetical protein
LVLEGRTFTMKMNTTHTAFYTVTDTKWQFGAGAAHMYDEKEHHARTGAPFYSAADPDVSISLYQHRQNP